MDDARAQLTANMLLVGAALAVIGNALHPFLSADITATEMISKADDSAIWVPLHLLIGVAIVLLTAAVVLVAMHMRATAGASLATVGAVIGLIGGTIFTFQIVVLDGFVFPALARAGRAGIDVVAAGTAMQAFDTGLLSLVVAVYFGGAFLVLGLAFQKSGMFATWIQWTAIGAGVAGLVVGTMMLTDVASDFTIVAFRIVALATTVVAIGLGMALRSPAAVGTPAASSA